LFWASSWKYSQADMIQGLRYIEPTASFRSEWQYHNVVYALGGVIIGGFRGRRTNILFARVRAQG
jgi:hypothetical protein